MKIPEASIAVCKCTSRHKLYGIRCAKISEREWHMTWAFEMEEKTANKEGYGSTIMKGDVIPLDEYPGCPYCGNRSFFICGRCGKLNCLEEEISYSRTVSCEWCGNQGRLEAYDGSGIKSGGDR